jgi:hypothetical protein
MLELSSAGERRIPLAKLVLQTAGSVVGGVVGGPFGAAVGRALGGLVDRI